MRPVLTVYSQKMLLYAITDRRLLPGSEQERQAGVVALARNWAARGVDYIQIREKDLSLNDLRKLTAEIVAAVRSGRTKTQVLLNGPAEIALEAGADGVHLPGNPPTSAVEAVRALYAAAGREPIVSRACHSVEQAAGSGDASLILFAPVFEKKVAADEKLLAISLPGLGLDTLARACRAAGPVPVFALGGVTGENAPACVVAGAVGIAAIRLFLSNDWHGV
jgi:thiamine-phosphate pyrophosphorylase